MKHPILLYAGLIAITAMGAIDANAQSIPNEEPVKVSYRKDFEWIESHDNLPLTYRYIVYRDKTYADGTVVTDKSRDPYGHMVERGSSLYNYYMPYGGDVILANGAKVRLGNYVVDDSDIPFEGEVYVERARTGVEDVNRIEVRNYPNFDGWDYTYDDSEWYPRYKDTEYYSFYFYPGTSVEGWYVRPIQWGWDFDYRYNLSEPAGIKGDGTLLYSWYSQFFYLDGQLIDFSEYHPTFDPDIRIEDITLSDGRPAKVLKADLQMKFFDRDFYQCEVDTIYQLSPEELEQGEYTRLEYYAPKREQARIPLRLKPTAPAGR